MSFPHDFNADRDEEREEIRRLSREDAEATMRTILGDQTYEESFGSCQLPREIGASFAGPTQDQIVRMEQMTVGLCFICDEPLTHVKHRFGPWPLCDRDRDAALEGL